MDQPVRILNTPCSLTTPLLSILQCDRTNECFCSIDFQHSELSDFAFPLHPPPPTSSFFSQRPVSVLIPMHSHQVHYAVSVMPRLTKGVCLLLNKICTSNLHSNATQAVTILQLSPSFQGGPRIFQLEVGAWNCCDTCAPMVLHSERRGRIATAQRQYFCQDHCVRSVLWCMHTLEVCPPDLERSLGGYSPENNRFCNCWCMTSRNTKLYVFATARKCPMNFVLASFQLLKPHVTSDALEVGGDVLLNNTHGRQLAASPEGL